MPARNITVTAITLRPLIILPIPGGYRASLEYNITFSDGTGQSRSLQREFTSGPRKIGLDDLYVDIRALITADEGVTPA